MKHKYELLFIILMIIIIVGFLFYITKPNEDIGLPYDTQVVDDHEVILTHKGDTIRLYMEDAWSIATEYVIYVKQ